MGGGDFFGLRQETMIPHSLLVEGRGKGGGGGRNIRLTTSHTERTKFFIARKKAASFRDT